MIDRVVHRHELRDELIRINAILKNTNSAKIVPIASSNKSSKYINQEREAAE